MEYVPPSSFVAEILPVLIAVWMTLLDLPVARAACPMLYMWGSLGFCIVRLPFFRAVAPNALQLNGWPSSYPHVCDGPALSVPSNRGAFAISGAGNGLSGRKGT